VLFNGDRIAVCVDDSYEALGVDTPEDLERIEQLISARE
jgi:CMP-2-keto-3-deoxyoctulosonic acid synthetase